ncbi:uncharacterized protein LOC115444923 isoform X2 [Manduca sexta]|uniref:uncharacterized protein LOC115444923 isoform X2 n=1 Tax=Manduca sexta TaxID=7130 RepID=UPI00188E3EEF|nr:uncharacterized protein LOC115444923 isoform X2 [Manduca sexta]
MMNCFEYLRLNTPRIGRVYNEAWSQKIGVMENLLPSTIFPINLNIKDVPRRRFDLLTRTDDIVKEHAKLVQDINGLKQVVFIPTIGEDSKDYEDSIFHEIIETSTTLKPMLTKPSKTSSIPIILLGGASQRHVVKSLPVDYSKPVINLVGTTISPVKHSYPFVMPSTSRKPFRVCMSTMPMYSTTTKQPSLWERLLNSIIPR